MVRFQVFDAVTGEETSEDALPRDIQGILNRYKNGSQAGGGDDLSRLARRQGQGMVGARASGAYDPVTRLPNNRMGKAVKFDFFPKTQEELEEDADASYRYGAAPFDLFLGRGETFIDPTRGKAFLEGQSEEERAAGFQAFLENVGRRTPNYTLAEQQADRQFEREAAVQADSERRQSELDGLKQYYDARTARQLLDASNASRNVLAAPDEWEVGDEDEWSVSQRAFDELWTTRAAAGSDDLETTWTQMQRGNNLLSLYGSTADEIISGLLADNEAADKLAREWAERAAQPGATSQVKKAAEDAQLRAQRNRDLNFGTLARYRELADTEEGRIVARVQELAGDDVDIFDRDFDKDDFYREAMRAVRVADQTASADVGDMATPEGQAQAMAHLTDFSIVSEKGGETLISHELVQSPAEAEAALTYTFMTTPLSSLFAGEYLDGEYLDFLRNESDTSNWSVVGEDELSSPPSRGGLGAIMPMPDREEQFYELLAYQMAALTEGKSTDPAPGWYSQAPPDVQVAVAKKVHQNLIATINPETGFPSPMLPTQTGATAARSTTKRRPRGDG